MTWARKAGERLRAMRSDEGAVEAVIALVRWMRGDRVERPWRLTRRQRVEMEAALMLVRDLRRGASVYDAARALGCDPSRSEGWPGYRIARARIAIALRAALRADEDARCEEAALRIGDAFGYDAECAIGEMREWPAMAWVPRVPLALWERRPSLLAQSPPTSDPRGPR